MINNRNGHNPTLKNQPDIAQLRDEYDELSEKLKKYEDAFNSITDLFSRANKDGIIEMVSPSVINILGYTPEEFKGKKAVDLYVNPKDRDVFLGALERDGFCQNFETRLYAKDGSERYVSMNSRIRYDKDGNVSSIDCITRDITDAKRVENELMVSRKQFKELFEFSPDAVFIHDFEKIIEVNQAFLHMFGYSSKDEVLGRPPKETVVFHEDYHLIQTARNSLKDRDSFKINTIRHVRKGGKPFYAETVVSPIIIDGKKHLQITSRDVTRRKLLEIELIRSEEKLTSINENSPDLISMVDRDLKVVYINRVLEGFTLESVLGSSVMEYVPEAYRDKYRHYIQKAFNGERQEFEMVSYGRNHDSAWYSVRMSPVFQEDGIDNLLIISTDITERKKTELRHQVINTISRKLNAVADLDDFCKEVFIEIQRIKRFPDIYISRYNEDEKELAIIFGMSDGEVKEELPLPRINGNGLSEYILKHKRGLLFNETSMNEFHEKHKLGVYGPKAKSWIGVPLISDDKVVGVLAAQSFTHENAFNNSDMELLAFIGTQIGSLIEKHRAESEIRQLEKYFSVSMDLLCIASTEGYFKKVNPKFSEVLGFSEEELLSRSFIEFVHPEDRDATLAELANLSEGNNTLNFMNRYLSKNGEYKWFLWAAAVDLNGNQVYAAAKDITAQKESQERLKALTDIQNSFIGQCSTAESFQKMLDVLIQVTRSEFGFIGEVLHDHKGTPYLKAHALTNIAWNTETLKIYEKQLEKGMEFRNLKTLFGKVLVTKQPIYSNDPTNDPCRGGVPPGHPDLNTFMGLPLFDGKEMIGMVGMANKTMGYNEEDKKLLDPFLVTCSTLVKAYQNQSRTDQVKKEVRRLADIVSHSSDAIVSTDQEGIVVSWNSGAENMLGYKAEEIIGLSITKLNPPVYAMIHMRLMNAVQQGKAVDSYETKLLRKDNSEVHVNLSMFPLTDENGKVKGVSAIVRDITAQREAERMKENFTRRLEQKVTERTRELETAQDKLAESLEKEKILGQLKSRFVATVSHQFRTPLTVIQSSLGVLDMQSDEMGDSFKPKFDRVYKRITGQVGRMTELMNDVLILGKINSGSVKPDFEMVDIAALAEKITKNYDDIQADGRKLICEVNGTPRSVWIDGKLFGHALSNLVSNAFKYSEFKPSPRLEINFRTDELEVSVTDYGVGIPEEEIEHLFDPFYRASNVGEIAGTGLGLSITKEYVELNNGRISVESSLNKETKFTMKFNPTN